MIKKSLILFSLFFLPGILALGQAPGLEHSNSGPDQFRKEGQLVSIQISKGDPIRIFVVGREEAKIDPATMTLTVRMLKPYPGKVLSVDKFNHYFVVSDPKEFQKAQEIEIVTKIKDKNETLRFHLSHSLDKK